MPAAPAPVAGDAVARLPLELRADNHGKLQLYRTEFSLKFAEFAPGVLESERRAVFAALAQDRAAQPSVYDGTPGKQHSQAALDRTHGGSGNG